MPSEEALKAKVLKMRERQIHQWPDEKFEELRRKFSKSHSTENVDRRAFDFLDGNNCVLNKQSRRLVTKIIFNLSKVNSANL